MTRHHEWLLLAATFLVVALCTRLGVWQLDRAAAKEALHAALASRGALPPLPAGQLATTDQAATAQHYRATVLAGRWLGGHTVYLDNRQVDGRPGFFVFTPLLLADGSAVAVQRGWLPRDFVERTRVQAPPLAAGEVQIAGRVAPPPSRLFAFGADPAGSRIRQNLDLAAWSAEIGRPLRPLSLLQQDGAQTPADGLRRTLPQIETDVSRHHGYAAQWFAFAALAALLYVWFRVVRPRRRR
ncbi:SURF1 family cytochrome oxidase biogenesis protein [Rubrivivax gelatinosus]|uniref:SURF1-like protein n=1 Tax=Rubrivivax gelatinosus TaxID=28068 RepID=A0ABS1DSR7_RUBGE|nr:hypothetical protein [Rubrivivax gelatinosus]